MSSDTLYLFIEGDDDERLFRSVLWSGLSNYYSEIKTIQWVEKKDEYVNNYLKSIKAMKQDYIFCTDLDECTPEQKVDKITKKRFCVEVGRLYIVAKAIESWYIAGIDPKMAKRLGLCRHPKGCENVCGRMFSSIRPKRFETDTDFMIEILKAYSVALARKNNKSFDHFYCREIKL